MKRALRVLTTLLLAPLAALHAASGDNRLEPFEPANGERLINYHPHFQWRGPEMTLDYQPECEIQIATEPDFKKLLATDVIGGGMNRFYSMVSLAEQREYFWRVRIQKPEIGPWSEAFRFTVVAPEKQFTVAKGSDSATVLDILRKAASTSKAGHTVEVIFEKGDYRVGPVKDHFDFRVHDVPAFRIEGNGSSITLVGDSFFAEVTGSRNVEIRRLTMKWDKPGHVMMEVTKVLPDTREIEAAILPQYPLKDLEFYWPVGGANTFLIRVDPKFPGKYTGGIKTRTPRQRLSEGCYRIGPIEERDFKNWQIGDRLAATHYRGGFIQNHDNDKLVLKDITFVDAPGAISGNGGRNDKVAYLNLKVMPDPRFTDSRLAGHASSEGGRVAAWIEGCEFNMLGDDNYNSGYFADYELLRQHDEQTLTMKIQPWDELIIPGDRLRFADQTTNRGIGEAIAVSVDNSVRDEVKVVLDRKLPQIPASTIASNNQGNQRYVYRNNRQLGGRGHGLKFKGYGTLIENNVFENIAGIGIYLGCAEGAPRARSADMATVRRNTLTLCGWHSIEAGQVAAPSERIRIEDNVIRDSKMAGIFLLNVQGAVVRGNTFESVTTYFAPTEAYESIILRDSMDVRVSGEVLKDKRVKGFPVADPGSH
jgi:parallel beta-helix repeat protein